MKRNADIGLFTASSSVNRKKALLPRPVNTGNTIPHLKRKNQCRMISAIYLSAPGSHRCRGRNRDRDRFRLCIVVGPHARSCPNPIFCPSIPIPIPTPTPISIPISISISISISMGKLQAPAPRQDRGGAHRIGAGAASPPHRL
jgi:hypothetical protein